MAEGGGLLNRYRVVKPYRGFESLRLRHHHALMMSFGGGMERDVTSSKDNPMTLTFRCPAELEGLLPPPVPAALGLPDWFKAMPLQQRGQLPL